MRKLSLIVFLAMFILSPMYSASTKGGKFSEQYQSGFSGPVSGAMAETVAKARELPDDAPVVLTGSIVSRVAGTKHKFTFKDSSGEIIVDIDNKAFRGQTVTPQDTIRISGKVDKDWGKDLEIDVRQLEILKQ